MSLQHRMVSPCNRAPALSAALVSAIAIAAMPSPAHSAPGAKDKPHCVEVVKAESFEGIERIAVDAGPSELRIAGEPDRTMMGVIAALCDSDATPSIQIRRERDTLHLEVKRSDAGRRFMMGPSTSMLVTVSVPPEAVVTIVEMIGPTSIHHVSGVEVRRGMGALTISDIQGDVQAHKGMGAMSISRITGDVEVSDGAGQMWLSNIEGSVRVAADGAGQVVIRAVRGDVQIAQDSRGVIDVDDIGGSFTVEHKTTGHINHSNVRGVIRIPEQNRVATRGRR